MKDGKLLGLWNSILHELALEQNLDGGPLHGHIVSPVSNAFYSRDTAFGAQIFATEYIRTNDTTWLTRTQAAYNALDRLDVYKGLDEPIWNRFGWHHNKGSLATTGMLLDAVWETMASLKCDHKPQEWEDLGKYLASCLIAPGRFAHDSVEPGQKMSAIQNTTAISLYLLQYAATIATPSHTVFQEVPATFQAIKNGQSPDGFWPYVYPDATQRLLTWSSLTRNFNLWSRLAKRVSTKFLGDRSIFFGDAVHHVLVLHYLLKSMSLDQNCVPANLKTAVNGWRWTRNKLVATSDGGFRFDFEWEPLPYAPRYCNFRETSTYFLILGSLPYLQHFNILSMSERQDIQDRLLTHIVGTLQQPKGTYPCITPYEGPVEILRNILPRVGESVAWKGSCLCHLVLEV